MTEPEKAYQAAQRLIAQAAKDGENSLNLDTPQTRGLTTLPPEIANLPALRRLGLRNTLITDLCPVTALTGLTLLAISTTPISDLAPLSALTGLTALWLGNTLITDISPLSKLTGLTSLWLNDTLITDLAPLVSLTRLTTLSVANSHVLDLRPLRRLANLADRPARFGLNFKNTPATRSDARIAEIAKIKNEATRARELFAYLENWVAPGEIVPPAKPDPIFETILINGQLELAADPPSQAERDEALKRALHERLQTTAPELARAAGNHFPRLASKARVLQSLIEKPFAELDLLSIHLEVEILHDRLTRGTEEEVPFPDDVLGPLADATRLSPGLTLGHPSVDLYIARVREARENPSPAEDEATNRSLSLVITQDPAANGPNSIAMENRILALEDTAERLAAQKPKHQWLLWALAMQGALADTTSLVSVFAPAVAVFIATNAALLGTAALTYGAPFALWFATVMGPVFLALGVEEEVVKRMKK